MKNILSCLLTGAVAVLTIALCSAEDKIPKGALEKIIESLPDKPCAKPVKPRKLLVFSKTNGFRHASIPTGRLSLTEMGRKTGAFETVISDDIAEFEGDRLNTYDAVCFLSPTQNVFGPDKKALPTMSDAKKAEAATRETRLKDNLMKFIKSGRGYIGIKRTDNDFGIAWARHWEKGRVFYCSLGHNHEIYWHPKVVRHYLAGIQWALGDYKVEVNGGK